MHLRPGAALGALSFGLTLASVALSGCTTPEPAEKAAKQATPPSSDAQNAGSGTSGAPSQGSAGETVTSGSDAATVYVLNLSVETICYVYLGDGTGTWTDDLLGNYVLDSGDYLTVTGVTPGYVELYAEGCGTSDWYGSGTVDSEFTFLLEGGGSDTGYYDTGWDSGF
jgi:hypothetical protein